MKKKITTRDQRLVACILTEFLVCETVEDFLDVWQRNYELFDLCADPFTGCPCAPADYEKSCQEYERQIMLEKYGHCDGLD